MYVPDFFASLASTRAERWRGLTELARDWFGAPAQDCSYGEDAVQAAETRLGFPLPAALRDAYLLFARKLGLASALDTIWPPHWLEMREGLLVIAAFRFEWGIAEPELAMDDPPVIRCDDGEASRPVFRTENSLSRLLVLESIHHAAKAGRYTNRAPTVPVATAIAVVERSFVPLAVGELPLGAPTPRLYGGDRCIVSVHPDTRAVYVAAQDLESYRAAVAALGGLRWEWTEQQARRGAFLLYMERWEAVLATVERSSEMARSAAFVAQKLISAYRAAPPRPAPLDPRVTELVTRAFRPYEGLLPRAAAAFFVEAAGFALDSHPTLDAWTNAFLGKPRADDVARPLRARDASLDDLLEAMPPKQREVAEEMLAGGSVDRMRAWAGPRTGASGALAQGNGVDAVLLQAAEQDMQRLLWHVHPRPPADPDTCERELFQTVRLMMAALFASVVGGVPKMAAAGFSRPCEGYRRAIEAFACCDADRKAWEHSFGPWAGSIRGLRDRLGVPEDDAYEKLRAFLTDLASTIDSSDELVQLRSADPSRVEAQHGSPGRPPRRKARRGKA